MRLAAGRGEGQREWKREGWRNRDITDVTTFKRSPSSRGLVPFSKLPKRCFYVTDRRGAKAVFFFDIASKENIAGSSQLNPERRPWFIIDTVILNELRLDHPPTPFSSCHETESNPFFSLLSTCMRTYLDYVLLLSADLSACSLWTCE